MKMTPDNVLADMLRRGLIRETEAGVFEITSKGRELSASVKPALQESKS